MSELDGDACSIECHGWWEQEGLGRQPMQRLQLAFSGGRIEGSGMDVVGPFTLRGELRGGTVVMRKHYLRRHSVDYLGTYDGEGLMSGDWRIGGWGGRWLIRLGRVTGSGEGEIREMVPTE